MGRSSKADARKPEILDRFMEVICEAGLDGASIGKVAKKMGVNPSLLIHYYTNRESMVQALIDRILSRFQAWYMPDLSEYSSPVERWEAVLDVHADIQWSEMLPKEVFFSCLAMAVRDKSTGRQFQEMYKTIHENTLQEIRHANQADVIHTDDEQALADMMMQRVHGASEFVISNRQQTSDSLRQMIGSFQQKKR